jgi:hypothetical protein
LICGNPTHSYGIGEGAEKHSGAGPSRRKVEWGSVVLAGVIGGGLGYLAYVLNEPGFRSYSLAPAIIAGLMAIAILGLLFGSQGGSEKNADTPPPCS